MHKETVLDNGIHILSEKVPHVRSVAVGFWVNVGSRDEPPEVAGITHFIEHLMFKGTETRTAREIAESLDAIGGQLNAFTTKEYTCYYVRVLDEFFEFAVDLLGDMLLNSRFAPEDLDRERNVILEEIKMYEDTPDEQVHDVFAQTLWQGHPLGRPIIGTADVIANLNRDIIEEFYREHYVASNIIVAVAGNVEHQRVVQKIEETLGHLEFKKHPRIFQAPVPHNDTSFRKKDTEQVHICTGVPGLPLRHENIYVLQLINTILGGGISSRLFQQIREEQGLVYSVFSYHSSYHDGGVFCIYLGLSQVNVGRAMELVFKEIRDIQTNGVSDVELQRAKDQLRGNLLLSLEHVNSRMSRLGKSKMYLGKVIPPEEIVRRINSITNDQIREVAKNFLVPEKFCLASVGPWEDPDLIQELKAR